jgi:hypothetical protein
LIKINANSGASPQIFFMQWMDIATAPADRDLELAVIDKDGAHALAFACRRVEGHWINAKTRQQIDIRPTHWREWDRRN